MSPSPERFDPTCGVNGNPLSSVVIRFTCQPLIKSIGALRPGQIVAVPKCWPVRRYSARKDPSRAADRCDSRIICAWLLACAPVNRRIHIEILSPGEVAAELQAVAQPVGHVGLQRVVAAVAFGVPKKSAGSRYGLGRVLTGNVLRALGDQCRWWLRACRGGGAARLAAGRARANLRREYLLGSTLSSS